MSNLKLEGACLQFPAAAYAVSQTLLRRLQQELGFVLEGQLLRRGDHTVRVLRGPDGSLGLIAGDAETAVLLARLRSAPGYRAGEPPILPTRTLGSDA